MLEARFFGQLLARLVAVVYMLDDRLGLILGTLGIGGGGGLGGTIFGCSLQGIGATPRTKDLKEGFGVSMSEIWSDEVEAGPKISSPTMGGAPY